MRPITRRYPRSLPFAAAEQAPRPAVSADFHLSDPGFDRIHPLVWKPIAVGVDPIVANDGHFCSLRPGQLPDVDGASPSVEQLVDLFTAVVGLQLEFFDRLPNRVPRLQGVARQSSRTTSSMGVPLPRQHLRSPRPAPMPSRRDPRPTRRPRSTRTHASCRQPSAPPIPINPFARRPRRQSIP